MKNEMYHACRVAFLCGQEGVPWHMVLHAIREGLDMKEFQTYILSEQNKENYPQLKELICYLKQSFPSNLSQG